MTLIRLMALLNSYLHDWLELIASASQFSVQLHTIVPRHPTSLAATDASHHGMGGFYITATANVVWWTSFPEALQNQLITQQNLTATITNTDLELAAIIIGSAISAAYSLPHSSIFLALDDTAAVSWSTKKHPQHHQASQHSYYIHYHDYAN
jgi:hypothetical protein